MLQKPVLHIGQPVRMQLRGSLYKDMIGGRIKDPTATHVANLLHVAVKAFVDRPGSGIIGVGAAVGYNGHAVEVKV